MEILASLQHHLVRFAVDLLRLCVWLVLLIFIFAPLERIFALRGQKFFRKAFFTDLGMVLSGRNTAQSTPRSLDGRDCLGAVHSVVPGGLHARVAASAARGIRFAASLIVGGDLGLLGPSLVSPDSVPLALPRHPSQRGRDGLAGQHARASGGFGFHAAVRASSRCMCWAWRSPPRTSPISCRCS